MPTKIVKGINRRISAEATIVLLGSFLSFLGSWIVDCRGFSPLPNTDRQNIVVDIIKATINSLYF
ncbi:MAG TPA: hypothetical protein VFD57_01215, partial [Clostridia bacterium]|nr:hypothetical protein [Clostridia bacterium]